MTLLVPTTLSGINLTVKKQYMKLFLINVFSKYVLSFSHIHLFACLPGGRICRLTKREFIVVCV